MVDTYGAPYPKEVDPDETISQGGYSSHMRAHEYFVFPIPDAIPSHLAAPMLCAGLTTWSPLVRAGVGPGKKVAIVGLGGECSRSFKDPSGIVVVFIVGLIDLDRSRTLRSHVGERSRC